MREVVLVTGGAGYVGVPVCAALAASGRQVRVLDSLLHGQTEVAVDLERSGVEVIRGDVRDPEARRRSVEGVSAVVHLAAIVGDPACALDPETAETVNVDGTLGLIEDARVVGVRRFVYVSTCSNYGRMSDPGVLIDENGTLAPVSLYARQKVRVEGELLGRDLDGTVPVCLRFSTVHGVAPRMRFDLTVNEFVLELWAGRRLEVFGEQFWRPYVHVADAARAVQTVLGAPVERVAREVFNVGRSDQNFRKLDLVELVRERISTGSVAFVHRDEDPRDYRVSFAKIHDTLGFDIETTVPDGIAEVAAALEAGAFPSPFDGKYRNAP